MSWCYLSMKLPPPLRGVIGKLCPHGRLTNESPCFREEGTFLSADGHQALGRVLEFLDFLDLPGSSLPRGCLSVMWPGLGRAGWWPTGQEEDFLSLISTSLLMGCLGVRSFGVFVLCGRSSSWVCGSGRFPGFISQRACQPPSFLSRALEDAGLLLVRRPGLWLCLSWGFSLLSSPEALPPLWFTHPFFYCFCSFRSLLLHWVFEMNVVSLADRFLWFFCSKVLGLIWAFYLGVSSHPDPHYGGPSVSSCSPTLWSPWEMGSLILSRASDTSGGWRWGEPTAGRAAGRVQDFPVMLGWWRGSLSAVSHPAQHPLSWAFGQKTGCSGSWSSVSLVAFWGCVLFISKSEISEPGELRDSPLSNLVPTPGSLPPASTSQSLLCVFTASTAPVGGRGNLSSSMFLKSEICIQLF